MDNAELTAWRRYRRAVMRACGIEPREMMPDEYEDAWWIVERLHGDKLPPFVDFASQRAGVSLNVPQTDPDQIVGGM